MRRTWGQPAPIGGAGWAAKEPGGACPCSGGAQTVRPGGGPSVHRAKSCRKIKHEKDCSRWRSEKLGYRRKRRGLRRRCSCDCERRVTANWASFRASSTKGFLRCVGRVSTFYLKQVAQTLIRNLDGVGEINNRLEVAPAPDDNMEDRASRKLSKEQAQMDADEPVTVYTLNDPFQAEVIKTSLRNEGIFCELDGERQAGLSEILEIGVLRAGTKCRPCQKDHPATRGSTGQGARDSGIGLNNAQYSLLCRPSRQTRRRIGWNKAR